jgi:hypothetical protein
LGSAAVWDPRFKVGLGLMEPALGSLRRNLKGQGGILVLGNRGSLYRLVGRLDLSRLRGLPSGTRGVLEGGKWSALGRGRWGRSYLSWPGKGAFKGRAKGLGLRGPGSF